MQGGSTRACKRTRLLASRKSNVLIFFMGSRCCTNCRWASFTAFAAVFLSSPLGTSAATCCQCSTFLLWVSHPCSPTSPYLEVGSSSHILFFKSRLRPFTPAPSQTVTHLHTKLRCLFAITLSYGLNNVMWVNT